MKREPIFWSPRARKLRDHDVPPAPRWPRQWRQGRCDSCEWRGMVTQIGRERQCPYHRKKFLLWEKVDRRYTARQRLEAQYAGPRSP